MLAAAGCSSLIEPEKLPCDISVEELQTRMSNAMDPNGTYRNAESYVQQVLVKISTWYSDAMMKMDIRYLAPGSVRFDYYVDNKPVQTLICRSQAGFYLDYDKKVARRISGEEYRKILRLMKFAQPDASYSTTFEAIELNECEIDGKMYYWMRCWFDADRSGYPYDVFVDKEDYFVRRIQFHTPQTGDYSAEIQTYAKCDDVTIPDVFIASWDGYSETCDLNIYKLNVPIKPSMFDVPADFTIVEAEEE